jgi:fructose-1,6-bisphosphatase I
MMKSLKIGTTLEEFTILMEKNFPNATGNLSKLLRDIGLACKIINREVNKAGLVNILGAVGNTNVQGEEVQKLDVYADKQLINFLSNGGQCAGIASEEQDSFVPIINEVNENAKYVVLFDPLDGSSNIDVNVSIGTIFSIYKRTTASGPVTLEDFLQKGSKQVAAGYTIYGSSTMLVYTTGYGVYGFTLDPTIGEFCLSHPDIKTPEDGKIYSINQGNYEKFDPAIQRYLDYCKGGEDRKPYSMRYIGSMVADFHRNLIKGGVFLYPAMDSAPKGKLRLLYECNPLAMIAEQAGGAASNGKDRILDLDATELHQRTPVFIGSKNMVKQIDKMLAEQEAKA